MSPDAINSMSTEPVKGDEIAHQPAVIAEFIDYIRWLADQDTGFKVAVGDLWQMFYDGVRRGITWDEVCHDLKLPEREDWY